jgi:hypothetical protein
MTAISTYDQINNDGDSNFNYMSDSLMLFGNICSNKLLSKSSKVLFLNKYDIFKKKIKVRPAQQFFPDAPRSVNHTEIAEYFIKKFEALSINSILSIHATVSTDSNAMTIIINETMRAIIKKVFSSAGL